MDSFQLKPCPACDSTNVGWYFTRRNRPGKPLRVVYVKKEKRYDHRVKEEREERN